MNIEDLKDDPKDGHIIHWSWTDEMGLNGEPYICEGGKYYPADVDESGHFTKKEE